MHLSDLDYDLPEDRIAQVPAPRREDARLLVLDRTAGTRDHRRVTDLPDLLRAGDLLVLNDTRVLPARIFARRRTGGAVEVLLLEPASAAGRGGLGGEVPGPDGDWEALVRAGGSLRAGEVLEVAGRPAVGLVTALGEGRWHVRGVGADLPALMAAHGRMPLPPYIRRDPHDPRTTPGPDPLDRMDRLDRLDRDRYQTLYARRDGAVAAPTAGLHLTPGLLAALAVRGVGVAFLTLHVGLGTFEPVRTERLEDHAMHEERYTVPAETAEAVRRTRAEGGRVVAVGTTSVRTLEASALAAPGGLPAAGEGRTRLLILPGHRFRAVDALLTNFHLPRSTLLALVAAFAGLESVLAAYRDAVASGYRFFSYGDAMLVL